MTWIQALILGLVQGVGEFLPISSSGHLVLIPHFFSWPDQGLAFDAIIHLGSLLAVIIYFRHKLLKFGRSLFDKKLESDKKLFFLLILSIIPAGIVGLFFDDLIENSLRSIYVVAFGLIFWGIVLGLADYWSKKYGKIELEKVGLKRTFLIGMAQAVALIPGTSRSGITMTAGLFSGLNKKAAAEFSFLMSIPIILLAGVLKIFEVISLGALDISLSVIAVGFMAAFVSGLFAIWGLMKIIQKWSFLPFVIYRIVLGLIIILVL